MTLKMTLDAIRFEDICRETLVQPSKQNISTEVWTWRGLVTYYTVLVIDLASRRQIGVRQVTTIVVSTR